VIEKQFDLSTPVVTAGKKVLQLPGAYTKCLIGRGGEVLRGINSQSGASVQVRGRPEDIECLVSITGAGHQVDKAMSLIRDILTAKGCHAPGITDENQLGDQDLIIPSNMVGLFIGPGGRNIKAILDAVGGAVTIKVQEPPHNGAPYRHVMVVGNNWQMAKQLVRTKILELRRQAPAMWAGLGRYVPGTAL